LGAPEKGKYKLKLARNFQCGGGIQPRKPLKEVGVWIHSGTTQ